MSRTSRRAGSAGPARLTLSRRFALISLLGIAIVATGVVVATAQVMRQQSISEGARSAETLTDWVAPMVPMEAFQTGVLDDARRAALAEATARLDGSVLSLRLWNVDGIMLFDSASDSTSAFPNSDQLESAAIMGGPPRASVHTWLQPARARSAAPVPRSTSTCRSALADTWSARRR